MMPAITRGGNTTGLMAYLVGPGRANEHEYPHVVAGDSMFELLWSDQELSHADALEIGGHLDMFKDTYSIESYGNIQKYDRNTDTKYKTRSKNHVWHSSLSLPPDEGKLSEEQWKQIAHDYMDKMGFTEASGKAPCQWIAVHHGGSKNGGDHIHIVANIVREDGTKWYQFNDWNLAQKTANELEYKYGLRVVESREHSRSARADQAAALNEAAKRGQPTTDRAQLETRMRAAATAAGSEHQYIELLTASGVRVKPRFASGRIDVVAGYSVALHTRPGQTTQWRGANNVARDLGLTRLRQRWPSTPQGASDAVAAWTEHWNSGQKQQSLDRVNASMDQWRGNAHGLTVAIEELGKIDPTNPHALADATTDISGLLSTMAIRHKNSPMGDGFDFAARQIGKHAQIKHRPQTHNPTPTWLTLTGQLMMTAAMTGGSRSNELVLFMQAMQLTSVLADLYRQVQQTNTAYLIERDTKALYEQIHRQFTPAENQLLQDLAGYRVPLQQENLPQLPPPPAPDTPVVYEAQAILETEQPEPVTVGTRSHEHDATEPPAQLQPASPGFNPDRIQAIMRAAHSGSATKTETTSKTVSKKPPLSQPGQDNKRGRSQ